MKTNLTCALLLFVYLTSPAQAQPAKALTPKQIAIERKAGFKGEYFLTRSEDPICIPFTKNLNQFRKLNFDECHPRLSEKFPEFSRPEWKEVPLDLEIAEKAFKDSAGIRLKQGEGTYWQNWLKETAELRAAGQVRMWLTQADINNDGVVDPIARVQYANPASDLPVKQRGCVYSQSGLWKLSDDTPNLFNGVQHFYFNWNSDIIYFAKTEQFYSVSTGQVAFDPDMVGQKIGATRSVMVAVAREARESLGPICYINWVPTGSYRPLQRNTKSIQSIK